MQLSKKFILIFTFFITIASIASLADDKDNKDVRKEFHYAYSLVYSGDFQAAITKFEQIIKYFPDSDLIDDAYIGIYECYRGMGDINKAIEVLIKVRDQFPNTIKYDSAIMTTGFIKGEWIKPYEEYLKRNPTKTADYARFELANLYIQQGNYQRALVEYDAILKNGITDEAPTIKNPLIEKALKIHKVALYQSIKCNEKLGNIERAKIVAKEYIKKYPHGNEVKELKNL